MMFLIRLFFYVVRLALFVVLSVLFRIYLLLIFLSKDAAPILTVLAIGAGLFFGWAVVEPVLVALTDPLFEPIRAWGRSLPRGDLGRDVVAFTEPAWLYLAIGIVLWAVHWCLGWVRSVLWFILPAFPMPRRPMPPMWRWRPRPHRIERVDVHLAVPRRRWRYWNGDLKPLMARLNPELQALLKPRRATPMPKPPRNVPERDQKASTRAGAGGEEVIKPVTPPKTLPRASGVPKPPPKPRGRPPGPKLPPRPVPPSPAE